MDGRREKGVGSRMSYFVGALTAGRRKGDGLIKIGTYGAIILALLRLIEGQLAADRQDRRVQHQETIQALRDLGGSMDRLEKATLEHGASVDGLLRKVESPDKHARR